MGVVAGEEKADRMGTGVVDDEGAGVAGMGEGGVVADEGDLILKVGGAVVEAVEVDVAVETDVDNRAESETGGAPVFGFWAY